VLRDVPQQRCHLNERCGDWLGGGGLSQDGNAATILIHRIAAGYDVDRRAKVETAATFYCFHRSLYQGVRYAEYGTVLDACIHAGKGILYVRRVYSFLKVLVFIGPLLFGDFFEIEPEHEADKHKDADVH